jgi:hypothetical protein
MSGACSGHWNEMRNAYTILVRKPEGQRPLGTHKCRTKKRIGECERDSSGKVN